MQNRTANPCTPVRFRARPPLFNEKPPHEPQVERFTSGTYPGTPLHEEIKRVPDGYRLTAYLLSPITGERTDVGEYRGPSKAAVEQLMLADATVMRRWQRADRGWAKAWRAEAAARAEQVRTRRKAWFKERRSTDPGFRLNSNIRGGIYKSLRGSKGGRPWEALVGYTLADLRAHLEALFVDGMTWANCGEWHVDHVRPLASFNVTDADCDDFKAAWALSNLQPLWGPDNLSKGAKWAA